MELEISDGEFLQDDINESGGANYWIGLLQENMAVATFILIGIVFISIGVFSLLRNSTNSSDIQIIGEDSGSTDSKIVVEVSGGVVHSGVYEVDIGKRVDDVIELAGGLTEDADTNWIGKVLNRAAKVTDGQKIYIPEKSDSSSGNIDNNNHSNNLSANDTDGDQTISSAVLGVSEEKVNINEASSEKLESMWGIGRVTAQNIIEQRPYSSTEELLTRKILKSNVYERNKDLMTVY